MEATDLKNAIRDYIKEHVSISVETKSRGSECTYNEQTYVNLYVEGELISSSEIEGLGIDH